MGSICRAPRWITIVARLRARVARSSPSGMAVDSVEMRVRTTVCDTSGTVSSRFRAAEAAANAGTPGTIS